MSQPTIQINARTMAVMQRAAVEAGRAITKFYQELAVAVTRFGDVVLEAYGFIPASKMQTEFDRELARNHNDHLRRIDRVTEEWLS